MAPRRSSDERQTPDASDRRKLFSTASTLAMFAGLLGSYGTFAYFAGRFLYPTRPRELRWMYVTRPSRMKTGDSLLYRAPSGETVNVTRQGSSGGASDFIALSSTCPHLGCQVLWEPHNERYFCPCHNGTFTPSGKGIGGPPGEAGMSLPRFSLKIENGSLFIEAPVTSLVSAEQQGEVIARVEGIHGPGHDPCLVTCTHRKKKISWSG